MIYEKYELRKMSHYNKDASVDCFSYLKHKTAYLFNVCC